MGPLAMAGLVCLGAAIGLGLLTSQARPGASLEDRVRIRGLMTLAAAFVEGIGVFGIIVGVLSVELGKAAGADSGAVCAALALTGTLVGIGLVARHIDRVDRQAAFLGAMFAMGLGVLGAVAGVLATIADERATSLPQDWPFVTLGAVAGTAALLMGRAGGQALAAAALADPIGLPAIRARFIRGAIPLELFGLGGAAIAIAILLFG